MKYLFFIFYYIFNNKKYEGIKSKSFKLDCPFRNICTKTIAVFVIFIMYEGDEKCFSRCFIRSEYFDVWKKFSVLQELIEQISLV